jgi:hypothetical protein
VVEQLFKTDAETLRTEVELHKQIRRYGTAESEQRLMSLILPIGNEQNVTTTFTTSILADATPQLVLVLRDLDDIIRAITVELIALHTRDKTKKPPLTTSEAERLKECKQMCLFAMYGDASRDLKPHRHKWDQEAERLAAKTELGHFHEDFQVSRPIAAGLPGW